MTKQITSNGLPFSTDFRPPLLQRHSVPITIRRYFTTVDGAIIDKALAPAALQVQYPFYNFGLFDYKGGYATGLKALPVTPGTEYLMTYIEGIGMTSQQITGFTGLNTIRTRIRVGDIVHVFTDSLQAPNYFIWIVQSSRNGSIGSILANTDSSQRDGTIGYLYCESFQYFTDNSNEQWAIPVHFTRSSNIASFRGDQVQPYIFKNPNTEQQGFVKVECKFNIDQYQSIGTYFLYNTEQIELIYSLTI